jgi:multiple sugar transport system substrate-binding protein
MTHSGVARSTAVAIGAVLALAACGNGDSADSSAGPVTLTFAAVTFTETGRGEALEAWVEEFNQSQQAVRVEPLGIPFATFSQTVSTQLAGGEGPDLIRFDQADFVQAAAAGLLEPLDEHIDFSEYDLIEGPDVYNYVDDVRYGVLFGTSNYALIYNADLVDEPPTTFEEFAEMAEEHTTDGRYGLAFRHTKDEEPGMMQDIFNFVYGFGGAFSDGENLTLNSPDVIEGLSAYQRLYDAEVIPRGTDAATYRRMFAEGLVAMEIDNGGVPGILRGANPDLNLEVVPNPFPVQSQGGIVVPISINSSSPHVEEAVTFLEWMLQPENQVSLQEVMGAESVATDTERTPEALEEAPYLEVYDELTPTTQPQIIAGFEERTPELRSIIIDQVLSALHGERTMQEAMDEAQDLGLALVGN